MDTQLKAYSPKLVQPSPDDKALAESLHQQVLDTIKQVRSAESDLERNYVSLGKLIYEIQIKALWISLGFDSWRDYFDFLQERFGKGRTQLYGYVGTVKALSPYVTDEQLLDIGITKAKELKRGVEQTGKTPSPELIERAVDPQTTVSDFREAIHKEFQIVLPDEKGLFFDLGGVFFTSDEKEEFLRSVDLAKKTDPPIDHMLPAASQMKEVLLRFAREYWAEYEWQSHGSVEGFNEIYKEVNG